MTGKRFSDSDRRVLEEIMLHRRDVRGNRFADREVPDSVLDQILEAAVSAPSVGFSQPWEFVVVRGGKVKQQIKASFEHENQAAERMFNGARRKLYSSLKLEGIEEAPLNIAVFYTPSAMPVLGQTTVEEVGVYSVVCAVQNMWLMARALNVGMGWVSILDPEKVKRVLQVPADRHLVAYLCAGYVDDFADQPELETLGWETRKSRQSKVHYERHGLKNGMEFS